MTIQQLIQQKLAQDTTEDGFNLHFFNQQIAEYESLNTFMVNTGISADLMWSMIGPYDEDFSEEEADDDAYYWLDKSAYVS